MTQVIVEPAESFESVLERFENPSVRHKRTALAARTKGARRRERPSD